MTVTRFLAHFRSSFCCLAVTWTFGIILGSILLTTWNKTRTISVTDRGNYPNLFELLQKRAYLSKNNPKATRALKICSPLLENDGKTTAEGKGIVGSKLESVLVLMRHGARSSLVDFVNRTEIDCSVNRTENPDYEPYAIHLLETEHRRSSRDPFRSFASVVPSGKLCRLGQLSELGALQQLRTGRLFRQVYGSVLQAKERDVTIVSTNVERTYQSAIAFLYGFIPDFDFAQIVPKVGRGSTLCYSHEFCTCPYLDVLTKYVEHAKVHVLEVHKAVLDLHNQLREVLGYGPNYKVYHNIDGLLDKLLVFVCHANALPCRSERACITVDQLNNVISYHEFRNKQLLLDAKVQATARLSMQGFLVEILRRMEDVRSRRSGSGGGFVFYSAHDVTVVPLTIALGFYDGLQLPYSARVVFELYSRLSTRDDNESARIFHLKILYNGKDVTKRVSFCSRQRVDVTQTEFCLLDTFAQFVNEDYLKDLNVTSFRKACQIQNS